MQLDAHQSLTPSAEFRQIVAVDTSRSPFCRLRPLSLTQVHLNDTFWAPRREMNRRVILPFQYQQCEATGCLDNFRRASGLSEGEFQGVYFIDTDIYKWLESAAWTLATNTDPELEARVNEIIALIAVAHDDNGYLNTYFTFERAAERWTDLRLMRELYCAGHLIQAAVAHRRATGLPTLLDIAVRLADHITTTCGILAKGPAASPRYMYVDASQAILTRAAQMEAACQRYGVPLAAAALQFSLRDSRITSTIVGITHPERVAQTVALAQHPIPAELWTELATI